jgi:hypothetical protein
MKIGRFTGQAEADDSSGSLKTHSTRLLRFARTIIRSWAIQMTRPTLGKITVEGLQLNAICDICGRDRAHGNHQKCSKKRQAEYAKRKQAKVS